MKVDADNPAFRFVNVHRVVTNLGVFDFNGPDHQMRAVSLHPGVEADQVAENTSFEVHGLNTVDTTRLPTGDEQKLISLIESHMLDSIDRLVPPA